VKTTSYFDALFPRWRSEYRYHTVRSQTLALLQQVVTAIFLLSGWQYNIVVLICWAVASIAFCIFIQSQMVVERPSRRGFRRVIRTLEVLSSIGTAGLILFLSGSVTNLVVLYVVYIVGACLTSELHGRGWIQFD
jgi:phage-related holin